MVREDAYDATRFAGSCQEELCPFHEADREPISVVIAICFEGVGIDYNIEQRDGVIIARSINAVTH